MPAANGVSNLAVTPAADGRWLASVDYAYTGEPKSASIRLFQVVITGAGGAARPINWQIGGGSAVPATHHFRTEVFNPNVHQV